MEDTILEIKNLYAGFGGEWVLKNINLDIYENKVTSIMGPSGCGKTTMVRCINRMHEMNPQAVYKGDIILDGKSIFKIPPVALRRKIGMVFQRPNPFPTMNIYDNVVSGYTLNGIKLPREEKDFIVEGALKKAYLWKEVRGNLFKKSAFLSGGQQQRLCIARALAVEPEILLMDEPASALDPTAAAKIEELIQQLKNKYTIVVVTHNMPQAARISDFTAFLMPGELIEYDVTSKMFTKPSKKITEDYITGRFG